MVNIAKPAAVLCAGLICLGGALVGTLLGVFPQTGPDNRQTGQKRPVSQGQPAAPARSPTLDPALGQAAIAAESKAAADLKKILLRQIDASPERLDLAWLDGFCVYVRDAASLRALLQTSRTDLVLLDWDLLGHPLADLVAEARSLASRPQVIVLGGDFTAKPAALAAGADAFVLKGDPPRYLLAAVQQARSRRTPAIDNATRKKKGE